MAEVHLVSAHDFGVKGSNPAAIWPMEKIVKKIKFFFILIIFIKNLLNVLIFLSLSVSVSLSLSLCLPMAYLVIRSYDTQNDDTR